VIARRRREGVIWARWLALYTVATIIFNQFSLLPELRVAHGVLVYLLLIIGASREGGRRLSAVMVLLGYAAVDWFFVPPRGEFGRPSEMDLIILIGFLATAIVISQLVISLRQTATVATARAEEIERLGVERLSLEREASRGQVLQEAERLKNALIASLSHDLRSPITTMTMLTDPDSNVPPSIALSRIGDEARRLEAFLSTLGRFTNSGGAERLLIVEPHVVEDLIGTALRSTANTLSRHVITTTTPDETLLMVRCDFTLSLQILGNLLENAARYSPPGSPIDVSAVLDGSVVHITVSDRGPGIAPDECVRVFRPLQRGRHTAGVTAGTGMGLAIAQTFAQAQRGDVTYKDREGGGSHFVLSLPATTVRDAVPV